MNIPPASNPVSSIERGFRGWSFTQKETADVSAPSAAEASAVLLALSVF
jgi:hypothetical protein